MFIAFSTFNQSVAKTHQLGSHSQTFFSPRINSNIMPHWLVLLSLYITIMTGAFLDFDSLGKCKVHFNSSKENKKGCHTRMQARDLLITASEILGPRSTEILPLRTPATKELFKKNSQSTADRLTTTAG